MSNKKITFNVKYKDACIIKHALRDKQNKDADEQRVYDDVCEKVSEFKERNRIVSKNHDPLEKQ